MRFEANSITGDKSAQELLMHKQISPPLSRIDIPNLFSLYTIDKY